MFDWNVNLGNVLTVAGTVGGLLWGVHKYDKRNDARHESNLIFNRETREIAKRIESKLDINTEKTFDVGMKLGEHVAEDRIKHAEIDRRLQETADDLRDHNNRKH